MTAVALTCTACANERAAAPYALGATGIEAAAKPGERISASAADVTAPPKKTQASKMLAAMALERVTGRKPDPSRLIDSQ